MTNTIHEGSITLNNIYISTIRQSWKSIIILTVVFFIGAFLVFSIKKPLYEVLIIAPVAPNTISYDATSLIELTRIYINKEILNDLRRENPEWLKLEKIPKNNLILTQRQDVIIIKSRWNDPVMAKQLGRTMYDFIRKIAIEKPFALLKARQETNNKLIRELNNDLMNNSLLEKLKNQNNSHDTISYYIARQSNYASFISLQGVENEMQKYIEIHNYHEKNGISEPIQLPKQRIINSILFALIGMLIGILMAFSTRIQARKE